MLSSFSERPAVPEKPPGPALWHPDTVCARRRNTHQPDLTALTSPRRARFAAAPSTEAVARGGDRSVGSMALGGPFRLINHLGKETTEKDLLGKFALLYFGFTHCPDICPEELVKICEAVDIVGADPRAPREKQSPPRGPPGVLFLFPAMTRGAPASLLPVRAQRRRQRSR